MLRPFAAADATLAAPAGAAVVRPGAFKTWVAPRATGQDQMVGEVVSDLGWGG